jgi:hypothetical protein
MQRVSTTPAPHSPPGVRGFSFAPANPCIQLPIARVSKRLVNQTAPKKTSQDRVAGKRMAFFKPEAIPAAS